MKKQYQIIISSILVFLSLFFLFQKVKIKPDSINLVMTAMVEANDEFEIFYRDSTDSKYSAKKSVKSKVPGSKEFQKIHFKLPIQTGIKSIRLDIGQNTNQKDIFIDQISIQSDSYEHVIKDSLLHYFKPNSFIELGARKNHFITHKLDRAKYNYDPFLSSIDISEIIKKIKQPESSIFYSAIFSFILAITFFLFLSFNANALKVKNTPELVFLIVFVAIICIPYSYNKFGFFKSKENIEKRELAKKPDFSFSKKYAKDFETYFEENFGLRDALIELGGEINLSVFNSSLNQDNAIIGKDGWLFFNKEAALRSYSNSNLFNENDLRGYISNLEKNRLISNNKDIKYFFSFWPNKHTIYSDFLPFSMRLQKKSPISKADQLVNNAKTNSTINIIDVRDALLREKWGHQLYFKNDTHWNSYGAFLAYQHFFKSAFPEKSVVPYPITDFTIDWVDHYKGDLIPMLGVQGKTDFVDLKPVFKFKKGRTYKQIKTPRGFPERTIITQNTDCGNDLKVVFFGDSFSTYLVPFISLHFSEVTYLRSRYNQKLIDKIKPNIIIDAHVERSL